MEDFSSSVHPVIFIEGYKNHHKYFVIRYNPTDGAYRIRHERYADNFVDDLIILTKESLILFLEKWFDKVRFQEKKSAIYLIDESRLNEKRDDETSGPEKITSELFPRINLMYSYIYKDFFPKSPDTSDESSDCSCEEEDSTPEKPIREAFLETLTDALNLQKDLRVKHK